jgi:hypothetical protein
MTISKKLKELAIALYEIIDDAENQVFKDCLNCIHFKEKEELCGKFNQRPPAFIIARACPDWEELGEIEEPVEIEYSPIYEDDIPF